MLLIWVILYQLIIRYNPDFEKGQLGPFLYTFFKFSGGGLEVLLISGKAAMFDIHLAVGPSSKVGIADDSLYAVLGGFGVSVGRKWSLCLFGSCLGIDLGFLG